MIKIQEALSNYNLIHPEAEFIRHNENITYKIVDESGNYLLRIHQPIKGFSLSLYQRNGNASSYIEGEMKILDDISYQKPVKNRLGNSVSYISGNTPVTLLKWIDGDIVKAIDEKKAYRLGTFIEEMHKHFKRHHIYDKKYLRYTYDIICVKDMIQVLDIALLKDHIDHRQRDLLVNVCHKIIGHMEELNQEEDTFGFIHGDLSQDNLIESTSDLFPIDFSLSGYGYYLMDLAFLLCNIKGPQLKRRIIEGYQSTQEKKLSISVIEAFFAMGVLLYIVNQHEKIYNLEWFDDKMEQWCKNIFLPFTKGERYLFKL